MKNAEGRIIGKCHGSPVILDKNGVRFRHDGYDYRVSKGGSNDIDNIQPLCRSCNSRKYTRIINFIESFKINNVIQNEI